MALTVLVLLVDALTDPPAAVCVIGSLVQLHGSFALGALLLRLQNLSLLKPPD